MSKALAMISGGLDSILAAKLIKEQGIEVIGICFQSYFFKANNAIRMCEQIQIPLKIIDFSKHHFDMVQNPKYGYGKNMNPCIDCHSMMMNYCGDLLSQYKADFIITGEVLNQRPMSQNKRSLEIVKNQSGFSNKILRPLCAKNLDPTEMELNGLVDREKLLDISGRSRQRQMELAKQWNIIDYPSPAGGCKLTEPNFSARLKDLIQNEKEIDESDIEVLNYGRHFRVFPGTKVIVGRTADESKKLRKYMENNDFEIFPRNYSGALVILRGVINEDTIKIAASFSARYCRGNKEKELEIKYKRYGTSKYRFITIAPISLEEINKYTINK